MKINKKISILLAFTIFFSFLAFLPENVFAETKYEIWVAGTQITDSNKNDVIGDGTVSYNAETNTLTLKDAGLEGQKYDDGSNAAAVFAYKDLKVNLIGDNYVQCGEDVNYNYGIGADGDLTIDGTGTLWSAIKGGRHGGSSIYSFHNLTIKNIGSIKSTLAENIAFKPVSGAKGICANESIIIKDSKIYVEIEENSENNKGIYATNSIKITGNSKVEVLGGKEKENYGIMHNWHDHSGNVFTIESPSEVIVAGEPKAFYSNFTPYEHAEVMVNDSASSNIGASPWDGTSPLGGTSSSYKYVSIKPKAAPTPNPSTSYSIVFDENYPNAPASTVKTTNSDGKLTELPTPGDREGYTFKGWFTNKDGSGEKITLDRVYTENTIVYGKWEEGTIKHKVTFETNGGSSIAPIEVEHSKTFTAPTPPTKEGYTFKGWFKEVELTNEWKFDTDKVTKDITLYAKWEEGDKEIGNLTHIAYIKGYPDGTFRPKGNMTRAEATTMIARLLNGGDITTGSKETKFSDANNNWYSQAVNYVVNKGYINGYEDGTFRPNQPITRAEFAKIISGYIKGGSQGNSGLKDIEEHWAKEAIEKVFGNKVVKGYPDGTFKPNQNITRAEAVTILNATFGRITENTSFSKVNIKEATSFIDVFESDWYYYGVLDASTKHEVFKENKDAVDIWVNVIH